MEKTTQKEELSKDELLLKDLRDRAAKGTLLGEFPGIPDSVYHHADCPGVSSSGLVTAAKQSYGHWLASIAKDNEPTPAMELGTQFHKALLEPKAFENEFIDERLIPDYGEKPKIDRRTKAGKLQYAEFEKIYETWEKEILAPWQALHGHKKVLKAERVEILQGMIKVAHENSYLMSVMDGAEFETSFWYRDPKTGVLMRCKTDIINHDMKIIVDVKSTINASPAGFGRSCVNFDYDVKSEFYCRIIEGLKKEGYAYFFYAAEKVEPFASANYYMHEELRENAKIGLDLWLEKFAEDSAKPEVEYYGQKIMPLELPRYGMSDYRFGG